MRMNYIKVVIFEIHSQVVRILYYIISWYPTYKISFCLIFIALTITKIFESTCIITFDTFKNYINGAGVNTIKINKLFVLYQLFYIFCYFFSFNFNFRFFFLLLDYSSVLWYFKYFCCYGLRSKLLWCRIVD
jgi:hypothetical protein